VSNLSDHLFGITVVLYVIGMIVFSGDLAFRRKAVPLFRAGDAVRRQPQAGQSAQGQAVQGQAAQARQVEDRALVGAGVGSRGPSVPAARPAAGGVGGTAGSVGGRAGTGRPAADGDDWTRVATVITVLGWMTHLATIVTRGIAAGRVPWGNMFEFSTVVAFIVVTAFLGLLAKQRVRWLGTFVLLPTVLYLGLAGTVLYKQAGPLVPALNSYWLKIHVFAAISATGLFFVSGIVAMLYLAKTYRPDGPLLSRLPSAERLERTTYGLVALSFPIWTFAIIAGAIWAEAAWGRYWGWDPKETWSFITWVIYAGYLHARSTAGWRGRRAGWFAVAAFAALIINYYVVNIWIVGLHSYAGVQ
jgi:cytochrome c-type biogenesis protein CcsB